MIPWGAPTYGEWALLWLALCATPAAVYYAIICSTYLRHRKRHDDD